MLVPDPKLDLQTGFQPHGHPGVLWPLTEENHFIFHMLPYEVFIWAGPIAYLGWPIFKSWLKPHLHVLKILSAGHNMTTYQNSVIEICAGCSACYIGEINRLFATRICQHLSSDMSNIPKLPIENQGSHAHPLGAVNFKFPGQTS